MTSPVKEAPRTVVADFLDIVDQIITTFLDAHSAITWALHEATKLPDDQTSDPSAEMYYVGSDHRRTNAVLRVSTRGEFKDRNSPGGSNITFFGNMCLVALYQYWEDNYRGRLAGSLGIATSEIRIPIMGDVRHLRRAIVHNRAVALPESERGETLIGIKRGDQIRVTAPLLFAVREGVEIQLNALLAENTARD